MKEETWRAIIHKENLDHDHLRVQALFVENMSGPFLQMLGTKYNIEPNFWSSSLGWIPSRFQSEVQPMIGDLSTTVGGEDINITLTFLRSIRNVGDSRFSLTHVSTDTLSTLEPHNLLGNQRIDPHSPLVLSSNKYLLFLDLVAVHFVRKNGGSTLISFHPKMTTSGPFLHERIRYTGQSIYWQTIFQRSSVPTFFLLLFLWNAMYAWDEALEHLYEHVCILETQGISTAEMSLAREIHLLQAYQLRCLRFLDDLNTTINFIRGTPHPGMDLNAEERHFNRALMDRECSNLLMETDRFRSELQMQGQILQNILGLVSNNLSIPVAKMTEAAMQDSDAMKQISYLTMFFLPGSLMAGISGMLNPNAFTLVYFVMVTVPLTDYIVDRRCVTREKVSPKDLYPTAQLAFHVDQGPPWAESQVESTSRKAGDDISVFNEG